MSDTARSMEPAESSTATTLQQDSEPDWSQWAGPDGELGRYVRKESQNTLEGWEKQPNFLRDQAGLEEQIKEGGYQHRQIIELLQNSTDSISRSNGRGSRIEIRLTEGCLYFADDGIALTVDGATSLMHAHLSSKQETDEIGHFGLGFKSLLAVSDVVDFFSKSASLRFDKEWSEGQIAKRLPQIELDRLPWMRLVNLVDVRKEAWDDNLLRELCAWATTVVRVKLDEEGNFRNVQRQLDTIPYEIMLLKDHIDRIDVHDVRSRKSWSHSVSIDDDVSILRSGDTVYRWKVFKEQTDTDEDDIRWAVPIDRLDERDYDSKYSKFWCYFPTQVPCPVLGIINAGWRLGPDRSNLLGNDFNLENEFNDELIQRAAQLIADNLHKIATADDPAVHLDALPRGSGLNEAKYTTCLRTAVFRELATRHVVPDGKGLLAAARSLKYPPYPRDPHFRDAHKRWSESKHAPGGWLHPSAMTDDRLSAIGKMHQTLVGSSYLSDILPLSTVREWLLALCEGKECPDAVEASRDAIQIAVMLPKHQWTSSTLGRIFLTQSGEWRSLDGVHLLSTDDLRPGDLEKLIHDGLAEDTATLDALKELGISELTKKERFQIALDWYLRANPNPTMPNPDDCKRLWRYASETDWREVVDVMEGRPDFRSRIPVKVADGTWRRLRDVIWPGLICVEDEAPDLCVDTDFHSDAAEDILECLGVPRKPFDHFDITQETGIEDYKKQLIHKYRNEDHPNGKTPREGHVRVFTSKSPGPLELVNQLPSKQARARYTRALLACESLFDEWTVWHKNRDEYEPHRYENYSLHFIRQYGIVSDGQGVTVRLSDASGHLSALRELVKLPTWEKIKDAFGFGEPSVSTEDCEAIDAEEEELLVDVWPGLRGKLRAEHHGIEVVRCSGVLVRGLLDPCRRYFDDGRRLNVVRSDDRQELESVNEALTLGLTATDITQVLGWEDGQVEARRTEVRQCDSVADRLRKAVGETNLRAGLPPTLVAYKERNGHRLSGIPLAEAAIATYDSGTLKHYRQQLSRLNPPNHWAGGPRTIAFVRSLGFPEDWAGTRTQRKDAFEEVDGPLNLKPLHCYQERIAERIVDMLQPQSSARRGMLSLPTGAGKTRVAVEGTIRAMLEHGSPKSVLWVADRDELCEQAVESWIQVWRCFGQQGTRLRVSRMWGSQPTPDATNQTHVIVASIQTLHAKLRSNVREYDFIKDVDLVVFDEAHRSIAPSFTNALNEIGFTPRQGMTEPFLMGLTATPYRGHNEAESLRLKRRYGENRLDHGAFPSDVVDSQDVVEHLQSRRILARARHGEPIEGGRFSLTSDELDMVRSRNLLSRSAEITVAKDTSRTERIIDAYNQHVKDVEPDAPTIIFATSVEHAMTLAAELSGQGVVARAVSGGTDRGTRRRIVEEFKRRDGDIKVLVNYGVFREGFDAPRTKVIIVARPVWSPNLYFQMIGRGLRGPENGGNDECLIINVRDNIENYERKLAFTEVDWLWDQ